jgi:lipopolysaccharide biosynthesis protein
VTDDASVRLIAFYLPQFHPIPENDEWWGKGFTEWTNVARARPLFPGHYQPHLPADLGFYDLRVPEVRQAQADLAREFGIEGFCYWHYWFNGRRLLGRPFDEVLRTGEPDFPFCLAWANETWSRRWLGEEASVLRAQTYSGDDDVQHARWLAEAFADRRYMRVQGRPLFGLYRPLHLPDARRTTDTIRREVVRLGLPNPLLLGINSHSTYVDSRDLGFDGTVSFEPALGALPGYMHDGGSLSRCIRNRRLGVSSSKLKLYDDAEARRLMAELRPGFPTYPTIFVGWDNTPRRGEQAIVIVNSTAESFGRSLRGLIVEVLSKPRDDRVIFINAWNEWAEGNHLEPDLSHGVAYLEAVRCALENGAGGI